MRPVCVRKAIGARKTAGSHPVFQQWFYLLCLNSLMICQRVFSVFSATSLHVLRWYHINCFP